MELSQGQKHHKNRLWKEYPNEDHPSVSTVNMTVLSKMPDKKKMSRTQRNRRLRSMQ